MFCLLRPFHESQLLTKWIDTFETIWKFFIFYTFTIRFTFWIRFHPSNSLLKYNLEFFKIYSKRLFQKIFKRLLLPSEIEQYCLTVHEYVKFKKIQYKICLFGFVKVNYIKKKQTSSTWKLPTIQILLLRPVVSCNNFWKFVM